MLPEPSIRVKRNDDVCLLDNLQLTVEVGLKVYHLEIAKGYTTDGLSIPRMVWAAVGHPLQGAALPGGLGHDLMYQAELLPRAACDYWFNQLLLANKVSDFRRRRMYRWVRIGGGMTWKKHTPESIKQAKEYVVDFYIKEIHTYEDVNSRTDLWSRMRRLSGSTADGQRV